MPNKLIIKHGPDANVSKTLTLQYGELASTESGKLYVGDSQGVPKLVGGDLSDLTALNINGTLQISSGSSYSTIKMSDNDNSLEIYIGPEGGSHINAPYISVLKDKDLTTKEYVDGKSKPFVVGSSSPSDETKLWIDTTPNTGGLKYFNGTSWVPVPVSYT